MVAFAHHVAFHSAGFRHTFEQRKIHIQPIERFAYGFAVYHLKVDFTIILPVAGQIILAVALIKILYVA